MWGSDRTNVWLVGQKGSIVHWNGKGFELQRSGVEPELIDLHAIFGFGSGDVWAAGKDGVILHQGAVVAHR